MNLSELAALVCFLFPFIGTLYAVEALPIHIDCGSPSDRNFTGGQSWTDGSLSMRYGPSFSYSFDVPNGQYIVTTRYQDKFSTAAGQRIMSVAINDAPVLAADMDLFLTQKQGRATRASLAVVADGSIVISLDGRRGNAIVSSIDIVPAPRPRQIQELVKLSPVPMLTYKLKYQPSVNTLIQVWLQQRSVVCSRSVFVEPAQVNPGTLEISLPTDATCAPQIGDMAAIVYWITE